MSDISAISATPSSLAAQATAASQTDTASEVSTAVFKKALDIQEQGALQLINSVTTPSANIMSGNTINTTA